MKQPLEESPFVCGQWLLLMVAVVGFGWLQLDTV